MHTLRLDNPFTGRTATKFNGQFDHDRELSYRCPSCGQRVNARDLGQVFHHEEPGHVIIRPQLVASP